MSHRLLCLAWIFSFSFFFFPQLSGAYICFPLFGMCGGLKNVDGPAFPVAVSSIPFSMYNSLGFMWVRRGTGATYLTSLSPYWWGQLDEIVQGLVQLLNNDIPPALITSGKACTVASHTIAKVLVWLWYITLKNNPSVAVLKSLFWFNVSGYLFRNRSRCSTFFFLPDFTAQQSCLCNSAS